MRPSGEPRDDSARTPSALAGEPATSDPRQLDAHGLLEILDLRSGTPVADLDCVLRPADGAGEEQRLRTDAAGRFALVPGNYHVAAADASAELRPTSFTLPAGERVILTRFAKQGLRVRVVDARDGAPLPDAQVLVEPPYELDDALAGPTFEYRRAIAGPDGVAHFEDVPALNESHLAIAADGYEPVRLAVCESSAELADRELLAALVRDASETRLRLRFVDSAGAARAGVLVRASMDPDELRWAGPDLALIGLSAASGELEVCGIYRRATQFRCSGNGWPVAVDGPGARSTPTPVTIEMPDALPGVLQLEGEAVVGASATVRIGGEFARAGESLLARCMDLSLHTTVDPAGRILADMPRATATVIVVTLADGRRATLRDARIERAGWTLPVAMRAWAEGATLEIVSLDQQLRSVEVFADEPGGNFECSAPGGGAMRMELPLREGVRGFSARSVEGRIVVASYKGNRAARPERDRLELRFLSGVEAAVRLVDGEGAPVANCRVELQPVMGQSDFGAPEFQQRLDPSGRWRLRAGNLFATTSGADGEARLELPVGAYEVRVASPAWRNPVRPWLARVPAYASEVFVTEGSHPIEIVVEPLRELLLDVSALRRSGALGTRWFVRDASGGGLMGCSGDVAELGVPSSGIVLVLEDETGTAVATVDAPAGREPWRWAGRE